MLPFWEDVKRSIDETGKLPESCRTEMIMFTPRRGWLAFIACKHGATNWIAIKRIPEDALERLK